MLCGMLEIEIEVRLDFGDYQMSNKEIYDKSHDMWIRIISHCIATITIAFYCSYHFEGVII